MLCINLKDFLKYRTFFMIKRREPKILFSKIFNFENAMACTAKFRNRPLIPSRSKKGIFQNILIAKSQFIFYKIGLLVVRRLFYSCCSFFTTWKIFKFTRGNCSSSYEYETKKYKVTNVLPCHGVFFKKIDFWDISCFFSFFWFFVGFFSQELEFTQYLRENNTKILLNVLILSYL